MRKTVTLISEESLSPKKEEKKSVKRSTVNASA